MKRVVAPSAWSSPLDLEKELLIENNGKNVISFDILVIIIQYPMNIHNSVVRRDAIKIYLPYITGSIFRELGRIPADENDVCATVLTR